MFICGMSLSVAHVSNQSTVAFAFLLRHAGGLLCHCSYGNREFNFESRCHLSAGSFDFCNAATPRRRCKRYAGAVDISICMGEHNETAASSRI